MSRSVRPNVFAGSDRSLAQSGPRRQGGPRALGLPRSARVRTYGGRPCQVDGETVESVRESWLVEDCWWTDRPLRRRYWEAVGVRGRNLIVFRDLVVGGWFVQVS